MVQPIKNPETEARCKEIAGIAKSDQPAAAKAYSEWVDAPDSGMKFWEKLAIKDRILYLIKNS